MKQGMRTALIVAHGQPSEPGPAAAEIAALAGKVAPHLPGWRVRAATLAEEGALVREIAGAGAAGLIYPLFMAGGWFTRTNLPRRLAEAGGAGWQIAEPFGTDPAVQDLALAIVQEALARDPAPSILLAAHGSFRSPAPAEVARAMAVRLSDAVRLPCEVGFIDQTPRIADVARTLPDALCLPFFAARGGHVVDDLPAALKAAGFRGRVLAPLGRDARVPGLIAAAIRAAAQA